MPIATDRSGVTPLLSRLTGRNYPCLRSDAVASHKVRPLVLRSVQRKVAVLLTALLLALSAAGLQAQTTNTNNVTNGGLIGAGTTSLITNPVLD